MRRNRSSNQSGKPRSRRPQSRSRNRPIQVRRKSRRGLAIIAAAMLVAFIVSHHQGWTTSGGSFPLPGSRGTSSVDESGGAEISGYPRLRDGDSFDFGQVRVRLHGIDAFEGSQRCPHVNGGTFACGDSGRDALKALIDGREVFCQRRDTDTYGRMVARCSVAGRDLGRAMVEQGWALAYRRYSSDYIRYEDEARSAARGVWAAPGFTSPWKYRSDNRRR